MTLLPGNARILVATDDVQQILREPHQGQFSSVQLLGGCFVMVTTSTNTSNASDCNLSETGIAIATHSAAHDTNLSSLPFPSARGEKPHR